MIKEIYDLKALLDSKAEIHFVDLEDTIFSSNIFYDLIGYKEYCDVFLKLCQGVKVFDVTYLGKNYKRTLMQPNIPEIFNELKKQGKKIFILTSGYPSHQKKIKIKEKGIKVDGFLFTRGKEKGPFLKKFLTTNSLTQRCAFVDNHFEKIQNVQNSFEPNQIDLFLYKKEFIHKIHMTDFINYWQEVIKEVKNGVIDKIKEQALLMNKRYKQNALNKKNLQNKTIKRTET